MFSKKEWELKFQPIPDYQKKIRKHSGYQENPTFTETINLCFPHKRLHNL